MLIVISPAKTLDFDSPVPSHKYTQPEFLKDSEVLVKTLRKYSPDDIAELMHVSSGIAELNVGRYLNWDRKFTLENARQAIYAFKGDVYTGLDVSRLSASDINFAQKHLRILSGLYGLLRPLDLMQPYRLEMGTKLQNSRGDDLYEFWREKISAAVNQALDSQGDRVLVNLASNEYFRVLDLRTSGVRIITPVFKDYKNGHYKIISFFAKKARGQMTAFMLRNRLGTVESLKTFNEDGYRYSAKESDEDTLVFLRKQT